MKLPIISENFKKNCGKWSLDKSLLLVIILFSIFLFALNLSHYDTFIGGGDNGEYIANSKLISEGKSFVFYDDEVSYSAKFTNPRYYIPSIQYHIEDAHLGLVRSDHFKGYPILMAFMRIVFGDDGYKIVSPLFGAFSLIVIFLIGLKLFNPVAGFIAAILLGTNWMQLWYSRFPMTETTLQFFLLFSLLLVIIYVNQNNYKILAFASCVIGLAFTIHISAFFVLPGFLYLLYSQSRDNMGKKLILLVFPAILIAGIYLVIDSHNYFSFTLHTHLEYLLDARKGVNFNTMADDSLQVNPIVGFILFLHSYLRYILFPTFIIFLSALIYILRKDKSVITLFILLITWFFCISFIVVGSFIQYEPWSGRRFVAIIYPITYLIVGKVLSDLKNIHSTKNSGKKLSPNKRNVLLIVSILIFCGIFLQQIMLFAPFNNISMGGSMPEFCDDVSQYVHQTGNSIIVLTRPGELFEVPFKYVYDLSIINVRTPKNELPNIINHELQNRDHVYLLNYKGAEYDSFLLSQNYELTSVKNFSMKWTAPAEKNAFPDPSHYYVIEFTFYEIKSPQRGLDIE